MKAILFLLCFIPSLAFAAAAQEVPRKILALYDPKATSHPYFSNVHRFVEMPLNHLGLEVEYLALDKKLPKAANMKDYRGIITWFTQENKTIKDAKAYCQWLSDNIDRGRRVVIMEYFGFLQNTWDDMPKACHTMFTKLGATYQSNHTDNAFLVNISYKNSQMVEFERKLTMAEELDYRFIHTKNPNTQTHLKLSRSDMSKSESILVFTSPQGGYVAPNYAIYKNQELEKRHWRINPFLFFEESFGTKGLPRPDTTTLNGRRLFYTHIDGDGIFNLSHIDRKSFSGEVIEREVLSHYPNVPITVSIITGYLKMPEYQSERTWELYRKMFSHPNVEPASHGHAHPFIWRQQKLALDVPDYIYTPNGEILGSLSLVQDILTKFGIDKKAQLFLWTGDCFPFRGEVKLATDAGYLNMNGGDTRLDKRFDSYSFVFPLSLNHQDVRQIYSSNSNENTYTNLWEGPYHGFSTVVETFANTESPIRIKPINIYYHFYSGERQSALSALKKAHDTALSQKIFAIHTSTYAEIAKDFFATQIFKTPSGFLVKHPGKLQTLRFDNTQEFVDLTKSQGVIGMQHYQGSLYVFLDQSHSHHIVLTKTPPTTPYIQQASFHVFDWKVSKANISFYKNGWFQSEFTLAGLANNQSYLITTKTQSIKATSDDTGKLTVKFPQAENSDTKTAVKIHAIN